MQHPNSNRASEPNGKFDSDGCSQCAELCLALLQHPCNTDLYSDVVAGTAVVVSIIIIQAAALGTYR